MDDRARGAGADVATDLTGAGGRSLLEAALATEGARLRSSQVRAVHRRGSSGVAVVHRVASTDAFGADRDRLWVLHVTGRRVPPGAARLELDGTTVHAWPFPRDPYLPGLAEAVSVTAATRLLHQLGHPTERAAIHTRSYRPTRRAVVELRPSPAAPPVAYVKLLGGRRADLVRARTARLVAVHEALADAGVPVPAVLDHDREGGRIVLAAIPGERLRALVRAGDAPTGRPLTTVLARLHASPTLPAGADPDGFADVRRHVRLLQARLPARTADLDHLAACTAEVGGPVATIHGDLHDGQLLLDGGRVRGLLDVDQAGTGHVAHDLGRLLAGIEASTLQGPEHAATTRLLADLHRWGARRCPERDLAAATAGAWVGLATGPLRVASPTWADEVDARLDRALAWAERAERSR